MPDNCAAVIDELVAIRKERGLTQAQLAEAAALAQSAIARLERKAAIPQLDTLLKVAAALGCDIAVVPASK